MADSNGIRSNPDFLHDQAENFLTLHGVQRFRSHTQFAAKLR